MLAMGLAPGEERVKDGTDREAQRGEGVLHLRRFAAELPTRDDAVALQLAELAQQDALGTVGELAAELGVADGAVEEVVDEHGLPATAEDADAALDGAGAQALSCDGHG